MSAQILATKLYIPLPRPKVVLRSRLIERLEKGLHLKLTLISAPAGFGKTTLLSEWVAGCERRVAWLSLDEGDNDPRRFLAYLVAALQTVATSIGKSVLGMLQLPQLPPTESILTVLAREDASAALAVLEPLRRQAEAKGWQDEQLKVMVLQSIAHHTHGEKDKALQLLSEALALAEPGSFVRLFVDEGKPMAHLLSEAAAHGMMLAYVAKLLAVFETEKQKSKDTSSLPPTPPGPPLIEGLSRRELEVLRLIAQGLSNREIGERLFLALVTVKGHNQRIFGKLQVKNRTEAVARARALGLL